MGDLLQNDFPGLVPVPGGNDAGMDAVIAGGKEEPFPLVCTTGERVHENLRKSLDAFVERGFPSRTVGLATSRTLTPAEVRKLRELAKKKGFRLLEPFERSAIAYRLYRNSVWCKRLLHLVGTPSALSVVPLSRRPLVNIELVGRKAVADWLRKTPGDRIIVGEPGSGKTYLFSWLIRKGWPALFLVSDNETEISNALRDQGPKIVIVDDAHVAPDRLVRLRHLREEIGGDFDIVASTWPGARNDVQEALGCPESKLHRLELLSRNEILDIIRKVGVEAPDEILRSLVDQSSNKPGLAITIARLWLQGDWQRILDGTVLSRTLLTLFRDLVGKETTEVLASFSLGGVQGVSLAAVGEFLELRPGEIQRVTRDLSAGGVLSEVDGARLAVRPEALRSALLREVFFSGHPTAYDYRKLLRSVPSHDRAVEAIVAARLYGAVIESSELRELVSRSRAPRLWRLLATVSRENAQWSLEAYPGNLLDIAGELLRWVPQAVIPKILALEAESSRTGKIRPDAPMNILLSWVQDIHAGSQEWIRRRRLVTRAAKKFLLNGGKPEVGIHGICIGLNRRIQGDSLDPGGNSITHRSAFLPVQGLREINTIWAEAKDAIRDIDAASWQHLLSTLRDWFPPEQAASRREVFEDERQIRRSLAERMLRDLLPISENSPGLQAGMSRLAGEFGVDLEVGQDEILELLYPPLVARKRQAHLEEAVRRLAAEWAKESPENIAVRIAFYEQEAQRIGEAWMNNMPELCQALAELVEEPEKWLDSLLAQDLRRDLFNPFLKRVVELQRDGWERQVEEYLENDRLVWFTASLILTLSAPPLALFDRALVKVQDEAVLIDGLCIRREVPLPTVRSLLRLPSWETALAAALGEWWAEPQAKVREEILPEWRDAILRAKTEDYAETKLNAGLQYRLGVTLASNADLALDWLRSRLKDSDLPRYFMRDSPFARAIGALGEGQRAKLLEKLDPVSILESLLPALIGMDAELYRSLLAIGPLEAYHLHPLGGLPGLGWEGLALVALDAGYTPEDIARAAFRTSHARRSGGGLEYEYWKPWDQAFAAFENHPREDLREVVRHGRALVHKEIGEARRRQKQFDLHGFRIWESPR